MPRVTQSRPIPPPRLTYLHTWTNGWGTVGSGEHFPPGGDQTTNSYRSGRKWDDPSVDSVVDAANLGTGLAARRDLNRALRVEKRDAKGQYDQGHEFDTAKRTINYGSCASNLLVTPVISPSDTVKTYRGMLLPATISTDPVFPVEVAIDMAKKLADGRRAISETTPTRPEAGLAVLLGELKQGLPEFIGAKLLGFNQKRRSTSRQASGGEYLNYEFGVKPLKSDVEKLARACAVISGRINQFTRDSGKVVRRKRLLYEERSISPVQDWGLKWPGMGQFDSSRNFGPPHPHYLARQGMQTAYNMTSVVCRFSGAYTYYLDQSDDLISRMELYEQKANHLLGTRLSAEAIWDLSPWSLLDWFGDFGTLLSNIDALSNDNLVLRYGYIMHHSTVTRVRTLPVYPLSGGMIGIRTESTVERKTRIKSTPYGFNVDLEKLSPRRWAILAALGMTKGNARALR